MQNPHLPLTISLALAALLSACGGHGAHAHGGNLAVVVTDAPFSYELVRSATIEIDRIAVDSGLLDPLAQPRALARKRAAQLTGLPNEARRRRLAPRLGITLRTRCQGHQREDDPRAGREAGRVPCLDSYNRR